ncbi:hypothetical protein A3D78_03965 [Candidatus Gottesmanbacteria bacterium RIFCSPHIGHO2_02_FULL_39_14]|uniref:Multidrug resistance protein MdtA-like barrel-sandwich hybrid domain-containing protein n=1 Tax=Candidatus Gottesmanbacteria bacterium RIFCSPHIGHO2_02_FULL_39_14 TaxID=1798383 RepID=A0A1F6A176_9BACT|nr:MAG: hypothetical protein A3D78_03965 [Candidatus Gottesmanbacteria bacterium RIFCSPHIGHO2_02_FULL_39_14]
MFKFLRRRLKLLSILVFAILAISFFLRPKLLSKQKYKNQSSVTVKKGDLRETLTISGEIDAEEKVTLRFQISGRLSWIGVREGDYVKKYQSIAALDKREVEKNLKKKLLTYMNERWDFEQTHDDYSVRGRQLYQVPGLTDEERRILDKAQFDLDSSVLDVEISNLAVEYANLFTPIAGIVTRISTPFAGVNITPAGAEFEIINPDTVYFSALADETEVTKVREGLSGDLILDAFPDKDLTGFIKNISFIPKSDESGTVYRVKFNFVRSNSALPTRLGMVGDLTFITQEKKDVLYLPAKYIFVQNGQKYVYVKRKAEVKKTAVKTGLETEDDIEIISGLKKGDVVYLPD